MGGLLYIKIWKTLFWSLFSIINCELWSKIVCQLRARLYVKVSKSVPTPHTLSSRIILVIQTRLLTLKEAGSIPEGGWSICFAHIRGALPIHVPMALLAASPTSPHFGPLLVLSTYSELHFVGWRCIFSVRLIWIAFLFCNKGLILCLWMTPFWPLLPQPPLMQGLCF